VGIDQSLVGQQSEFESRTPYVRSTDGQGRRTAGRVPPSRQTDVLPRRLGRAVTVTTLKHEEAATASYVVLWPAQKSYMPIGRFRDSIIFSRKVRL